jgi:sulfatase modifying factor 1
VDKSAGSQSAEVNTFWKRRIGLQRSMRLGAVLLLWIPNDETAPIREALAEQRRGLLHAMVDEMQLSRAQSDDVRAIIERSSVLGQGNPARSVHPMTREECRSLRDAAGLGRIEEPICGAPNMVPIYDPARGDTARDARVCIDQFEFPGIPCEYPIVHVTAREAVQLCEAVGKRICDAHEWEGACAGQLRSAEQEYGAGRPRRDATALHNASREKVWAYGATKDHAKCATSSSKSPGCVSGFAKCGSNTYPAGAFPGCVSPFGVYDLHGNVAEHMNLPARREESASAARTSYGQTEMKGSWFIFSFYEAHEDDCRWRAPGWHGSRVTSAASHSNYHLGFRCCKTVEAASSDRRANL